MAFEQLRERVTVAGGSGGNETGICTAADFRPLRDLSCLHNKRTQARQRLTPGVLVI